MPNEEMQRRLEEKSAELSEEFNGAPVVIVVAGSEASGVRGCKIAWANLGEGSEGRMRDVLGILEAAKQIHAYNHLRR